MLSSDQFPTAAAGQVARDGRLTKSSAQSLERAINVPKVPRPGRGQTLEQRTGQRYRLGPIFAEETLLTEEHARLLKGTDGHDQFLELVAFGLHQAERRTTPELPLTI